MTEAGPLFVPAVTVAVSSAMAGFRQLVGKRTGRLPPDYGAAALCARAAGSILGALARGVGHGLRGRFLDGHH